MNKKITILATLAICTMALAQPTRSMLGIDRTEGANDDFPENPTAADYIQDGLVALWDGIENSGFGIHLDSATTWVDLKGSYNVPISNFVVGEDYVRSQSSQVTIETALVIYDASDSGQMEVCISGLTNTGGWYSPFIRAAGEWCIGQANPSNPKTLSINLAARSDYGTYRSNIYGLYVPSYFKSFLGTIDSLSYPMLYKIWRGPNGAATYYDVYVNNEKFNQFANIGQWNNAEPSGLVTIGIAKGTCNYHCIRLYNRVLSDKEIHYNYLIDKLRFNLP